MPFTSKQADNRLYTQKILNVFALHLVQYSIMRMVLTLASEILIQISTLPQTKFAILAFCLSVCLFNQLKPQILYL